MRRRYRYNSYFYSDDNYWDQFLPQCRINLGLAILPNPTSKKELFWKLYYSVLIEGGNKRVWLQYPFPRLVVMVSAKALDISEGFDSACWQWVSIDGSRFDLAAELKTVYNFEVWQRIDCSLLTHGTSYAVSFVLKINKSEMPECKTPFTFSFKSVDGNWTRTEIYLDDYEKPVEGRKTIVRPDVKRWEEFVIGEFPYLNTFDRTEIEVSLENKDVSFMKTGIAIDGIKFQPQ